MFLGMSKDEWEIAGALGTWAAAVITLLAIIVSLWLAVRVEPIRLRVWAGKRSLFTPREEDTPEYVMIHVTNIGARAARITGLGWVTGRWRWRKSFIQNPSSDLTLCSHLPCVLQDGETAQWLFPIETWIEDWPSSLGKQWSDACETMRVSVYSSAGKPLNVLIERDLRDIIKERCREFASRASNKDDVTLSSGQ